MFFSDINNKSEKTAWISPIKLMFICYVTRIAYLAQINYIYYDETVLIYLENTENYYFTWKQTNEL